MCPGCDLDVAWLLGGSGQAPGPGQFLQEQLAAPPQTPRGIYWERRACREITKKNFKMEGRKRGPWMGGEIGNGNKFDFPSSVYTCHPDAQATM